MSTAIKVENLSKIYRLGEIGTGTISRDLERWYKTKLLGKEDPFLKIGESNDRSKKGASDIVYSLKDINFEIEQGDAVGIIGRNGAGKSTLLKILSRVTTPTTGRINIKGRVASLLEVGTGFHPELTGRENIYLNGAILGMRKKEIDRKLEEIIDFSGVERYIDTPVKRYSSGMYVRLAFAVAAHLESEILIVDEVLAVGDAEFQKKCLGKMGEVSKGEGRTVLFVSHNMAAVKELCSNTLILKNGENAFFGKVIDGISNYIQIDQYDNLIKNEFYRVDVPTSKKMYLESVIFIDNPSNDFFEICLDLVISSNFESKAGINLILSDKIGFPIAFGCSNFRNNLYEIKKGRNMINLKTQPLNLGIGNYQLTIELVDPGYEYFDVIENVIQFEITTDEIANRTYGILQSWGKGSFELIIK